VPGVPHLASIATHPRVRGQGIGTALTTTVTARLLAAGAPVVTLGMYADNDVARRMYARIGYVCSHRWSSRAVVVRR
jgi:predicted GNAT family acetyltransferase